MRRMLSNTFRSNLVEFDTDLGLRYASPPTFWVRIYLIWTFRNFRSLPKQVFNRHQQKLIDELIRSSTIFSATQVDRSSLIGTVEQVQLKSAGMLQGEADRGATATKGDVAHDSTRVTVGANRSHQVAIRPIRKLPSRPSPQELTPPGMSGISQPARRLPHRFCWPRPC